jgi:hypothetical protein
MEPKCGGNYIFFGMNERKKIVCIVGTYFLDLGDWVFI